MGCTLIHRSVLEAMAKDAPTYMAAGEHKCKQVFDTPEHVFIDPEKRSVNTVTGTEDLAWCNRVISGKYLHKAGWPAVAKKKYPFLCDTSIFCRHITMDGQVYPIEA